MPAPKRNRFAAKPAEQQHSETLYVRLRRHDKQRIVEAAGDTGVAEWARGVLLNAVGAGSARSATSRSSEPEPAVSGQGTSRRADDKGHSRRTTLRYQS
jgi:hypothetical protein